jgi:hypothetical protein
MPNDWIDEPGRFLVDVYAFNYFNHMAGAIWTWCKKGYF